MAWEGVPVRLRGAITMPSCGKCQKPVGASDVTCPHCGVLLAAYASPEGSGAIGTYEEPAPPPKTEIPSVDMDVKPPSEQDVETDPAKVAVEAISTAPRPLFDTNLTVEEIARVAEGDHTEDVLTIPEDKVVSKTVEFDVPDWARPPKSADPIPTIEEDDASVPLITRDQAPERSAPVDTPGDDDDDDSEPDPEPDPSGESWLYPRARATQPARPRPVQARKPRPEPQPKPQPQPEPESRPEPAQRGQAGPAGTTDDYLRKLHTESGYTPESDAISRPVVERQPTPADRRRDEGTSFSSRMQDPEPDASAASTRTGCVTAYFLVLGILWFSTVISVMGGNFSPVLIFLTFIATWGFGPMRRAVNNMQQS